MKFSTKSEYGLRALVNLAKQKGFYSLAQIAKEEKISLAYLERLFAKLKKAQIVKSQKGVNGGYKLAKPLNNVSVKDIFIALEGSLSPYNCACLDLQSICKSTKCSCNVKTVWQKLEKEINKTLQSIKLSNLVK
ncbi:RrF2 family transcriptional regulator [Patescibacteria group bacterium]